MNYEIDIEPTPSAPQQWKVDARWVLDMDDYNEWMNEEDYMLPLPGVCFYRFFSTTFFK